MHEYDGKSIGSPETILVKTAGADPENSKRRGRMRPYPK